MLSTAALWVAGEGAGPPRSCASQLLLRSVRLAFGVQQHLARSCWLLPTLPAGAAASVVEGRPITCPWRWKAGGHGYTSDSGPEGPKHKRKARWCSSLVQRKAAGAGTGTWTPLASASGQIRTWRKLGGRWIPGKWKKVIRSSKWRKSRGKCFTCNATSIRTSTCNSENYRSPACCTLCLHTGGEQHGAFCARN